MSLLGPHYYRQWLLPVYQEFMGVLKARDKRVMMHFDSELSCVRNLVADSPFQIIESLTEPPEGDMLYDDCRQAWPDKVLLGNLNVGLYQASGRLDVPTPHLDFRRRQDGDTLIVEADLSPALLDAAFVDLTLQVEFDGMLGHAYLDDTLIGDHAFGRHLTWEINLRDRLTRPGHLRLVCTGTHRAEIAVRPIVVAAATLAFDSL